MQGSDIKTYLDNNGIKQTYVSEKTNIPQAILNAMLNNGRRIEINEYIRICDALNLPLDYFKDNQEAETV